MDSIAFLTILDLKGSSLSCKQYEIEEVRGTRRSALRHQQQQQQQQQRYSPWWSLASLTTLLQPTLSSTLPLQPLTSITTKSIITLSGHLVRGRPFLLLENNLPFNVLLGIRSPTFSPHVQPSYRLCLHEP
jgi:hypothetical protein